MLDQSVSVSSRLDPLKFRFDILKFTGNGRFVWIEAAESLIGAIRRASALCEISPDARYMVFSQDTQEKIFVSGKEPNLEFH